MIPAMTDVSSFDIGLGLEGSHVMVTGGAGQIGQVVVTAFLSAGCHVSALDINGSRMQKKHERLFWIQVDVTDEEKLKQAFEQARARFGVISTCCAVAGLDLSFIPHHESICELPLDQWQRTLNVNVTGTFLTARNWLRGIRDHAQGSSRNVSFIIFGSEAGVFGVPGNADYATSKAAIQYGLLKSLAPEAVTIFERARVNAIAPGPVLTPMFAEECTANRESEYQELGATTALKKGVLIESVARCCLMMASETYSGNITGQVIAVDSGKSGRMLWTRDGKPTWSDNA